MSKDIEELNISINHRIYLTFIDYATTEEYIFKCPWNIYQDRVYLGSQKKTQKRLKNVF